MKIVTFGTLKGGTGKTTTSFNIAGCLAETNRVLLIDCDPQANLSQDAGIDITDQTAPSIKDIINDYMNPEKVVVRGPVEELPNLDIIQSNIWLTETEMTLVNRSAREYILSNYIKEYKEFFEKYDYVICDTNPSMSIINMNAFYIADSIVLVSDVSNNGLTGIDLFDYLWGKASRDLRKEENIKALLINNSDARTNLSKELIEFCKEDEWKKEILVNTVIPQAIKIKETSVEHKPVNITVPGKNEHKLYLEIIEELKEKGVL